VCRLANDVGDEPEAGGELVLVGRDAGALLDDGRYGGGSEGRRPVPRPARRYEGCVRPLRIGGAVHVRPEIGLDLEKLAELIVHRTQHVEGARLADEDDLEDGGDGLGVKGVGDDEAHLSGGLDGLQLARAEDPLQSRPGERPHEDLFGIEDQEPAVRPVQRAGCYAGEVGHHDAEVDLAGDMPMRAA
jgi:hypothetical protein